MARWCWNAACSSPFSGLNLAATARDSPEIRGDKAGAAHQRAVDIGDGKQLACIGRLDRSAIEDAHLASFGEPFTEKPADMRVHLRDVGDRWRPASADRPDRLVGD